MCVCVLMYFGKRSPVFFCAELFFVVLRKVIRKVVCAHKKYMAYSKWQHGGKYLSNISSFLLFIKPYLNTINLHAFGFKRCVEDL